MNIELLNKSIDRFIKWSAENPEQEKADLLERQEQVSYFQMHVTIGQTYIMDEEAIFQFISRLWAMRSWGNKRFRVDQIILENGLNNLRENFRLLLDENKPIEERWDNFKKDVKNLGPAMLSEILCKIEPYKYAIWNRRIYFGLKYLGVKNLPKYDYQLTGIVYKYICENVKIIADKLKERNFPDSSLLAADYFIWQELQIDESLSKTFADDIFVKPISSKEETVKIDFIHNEIRDKIRDIGNYLGFKATIEKKISTGAKIDVVWEVSIGNMGKIAYIFEVQSKGSIDSLLLNLMKANRFNSVQGIVAVSDIDQIEKMKKEVLGLGDLKDKIRFWDYREVIKVYESLEYVNQTINNLGLVPQEF